MVNHAVATERLGAVVDALLTNAVEAGASRLQLCLEKDGRSVVLRCCDDGRRLPTGGRGAVFAPGFTTKEEGTGTGLSRSRELIEELGGSLEALSAASGGAEFVIRFAS